MVLVVVIATLVMSACFALGVFDRAHAGLMTALMFVILGATFIIWFDTPERPRRQFWGRAAGCIIMFGGGIISLLWEACELWCI